MIYEVRVSPEMIQSWFTTAAEISARCVTGLPDGAKLTTCCPVYQKGDFVWVSFWFRVGESIGGDAPATVCIPVYERIEHFNRKESVA